MRSLVRHRGENSSSSWGKETIENRVIAPGQGSLGTQRYASLDEMNKPTRGTNMRNQREEPTRGTNERKGGRPKAQENQSKLIQARKTLKARDRVLMAAIRRCHTELAKRTSFGKIEASKDAVEAAWNEYNQAIYRYCRHAGWDLFWKEEEQSEEARRAMYEWKALLNMMEQVVDKAEEFLESATKENSCGERKDDGDDGGELDAKVELQRWAMAVRFWEA